MPGRRGALEHAWKDGDTWYQEYSLRTRQLRDLDGSLASSPTISSTTSAKTAGVVAHHNVFGFLRPEALTAIMEGETSDLEMRR
ncbi:hypothetical protein ACFL5O_09635 [Myxococcota bacterium]